MDFFKLLTRSTKHKGSSLASAGGATKLPSAGDAANPQLFHHHTANLRGTKRKREHEHGDPSLEVADAEVDFFAEHTAAPAVTARPATDTPTTVTKPPALLDDAECRQILKSHRIKVMALPIANKNGVEKRKKKTKKPEKQIKRESRQLYPQPLMAFTDLPQQYRITEKLARNITAQGYKIPTEVQMGSLPLLLDAGVAVADENLSTADLLVVAPTGSGKTLAFLIPTLDMIQKKRRRGSTGYQGPEAIVVAPTKELASQIVNEGRKLAVETGIRVTGMRKGMRIAGALEAADAEANDDDDKDDENSEDSEVESDGDEPVMRADAAQKQPPAKADILVTTPLALLHALTTTSGRSSLPAVRHLILDEADVLLDPLFREQTLGIWGCCTNADLRVSMWSATMGSNIETLATATIQSRAEKLDLSPRERLVRLVVGLKDSAIPNVRHKLVYAATEPGKLLALRQMIRPTAKTMDGTVSLRPPFLIFTQTIPRAVALHAELLYDIPVEAGGSSRVAVLHSDLSDTKRDLVMTKFRQGEIWVLITTDILARGVDFRGVNGVVNYDVPNSGAAYIHRVGRTGRAGRDGGVAVTLYTKDDVPYVKNVANIIAASEQLAGTPSHASAVPAWLLAALPTPSKRDKQQLKRGGVAARRAHSAASRISTKSSFDKRRGDRRKGAIRASRQRTQDEGGEESGAEWGGISE